MDNLEVKRGKIKRSIQSIIDQSALDHQYNFEAQQLRRAYNGNIKQLNSKIKQYERELDKQSLKLKQNAQIIQELQDKLHCTSIQLERNQQENLQLKKSNIQIKKRLQHLQYKIDSIQSNRNLVDSCEVSLYEDKSQKVTEIRKNSKKEAYDQINQIMNKKVAKFTKQMKSYPLSLQIQRNIQSFLEQILYINPQSFKHIPFGSKNTHHSRKIGQISDKKVPTQKFTNLQQWQKLQKSVEKLKSIRKSPSPLKNSGRTPRTNSGRIINNGISVDKIKKKMYYN